MYRSVLVKMGVHFPVLTAVAAMAAPGPRRDTGVTEVTTSNVYPR